MTFIFYSFVVVDCINYILREMTVSRAFLFILVFFASLHPLRSFASRGLYFSVSKMTSSQQNTISDYKQTTGVDVKLSNLAQSNVVDTAAINGKSFDFTTNITTASGYLSYDVLKAALNGKYLTGDVTFTVKTSAIDKSETTYVVNSGGTLTMTGANVKIDGQSGNSSVTTTPTAGGTLNYTIDGTTTGTTTSSIVASNFAQTKVCILDQATNTEACAPKEYITAKYGTTNSIPVKELFNVIINTPNTGTTSGGRTVYELPYSNNDANQYGGIIYTGSAPIHNTVSTTTNGASVTVGGGSTVSVTGNAVNSLSKTGSMSQTIDSIAIAGATTTTTKYACTDSTGNLNPGECDVEIPVPNVQTGTSTTYTPISATTLPNTTLFYKDNTGKYLSIPITGIPSSVTDRKTYIPNYYYRIQQNKLSSTLVNTANTTQTISTNGNTTFSNGTLESGGTFTNIATNGSVTQTTTNNIKDSGIELYSPLLDQARYISTPYLSIAQNIRVDPTKVGANWTTSTFSQFFTQLFSYDAKNAPLANNIKNAISYIDGDNTYSGQVALEKISAAYEDANTSALGKNIQSYASVADVNYTANALTNSFHKAFVECQATNCGFGVDSTNWSTNTGITQVLSVLQNASAVQNTLNLAAGAFNDSLEASKTHNLAAYQANYVKDSSGNRVLDPDNNLVKDGTYDVTLKAKDWSFEMDRVKYLVANDVSSRNLTPQFDSQAQMQSFVSALSGQSASGFEMSVGYKFRMFKSAFYAAPQLDISMFRNSSSEISGKNPTKAEDENTYTYGNLDSSYAGSLVAKIGFENKLNLGFVRTPFSIYGFGGGTSGLTTYRSANSQSFGFKYGFGAEIFVSKKLALFGEMFWVNFMKQTVNYATTGSYDFANRSSSTYNPSDTVPQYINSQLGTTVTLDNSQYGVDTKNLSIKYANLNQVIDVNSIKYTTAEKFSNQSSIQGMKFGLTYYVE